MIIFETQRLIARYWEPDKDAEQAFRIYSHPEVTRFIRAPKDIPINVDAQRDELMKKCAEYRHNDGTGYWPVLCVKRIIRVSESIIHVSRE
ncbi:GNAT family N-acetyltransferase [bacterium]|nr:GNAT family N-acetyltransferase [bacterium]